MNTDLGERIRQAVDAPLHPAALAAAVCTVIADQFELYANHEARAARRNADAGQPIPAVKGEGVATAYRRAATQMRDLTRMLTARPADPGPWKRAIDATPDGYRDFLARLTRVEGLVLTDAGVPLDPMVAYTRVWQQEIWPELVEQLDDLIRAQGGGCPRPRPGRGPCASWVTAGDGGGNL